MRGLFCSLQWPQGPEKPRHPVGAPCLLIELTALAQPKQACAETLNKSQQQGVGCASQGRILRSVQPQEGLHPRYPRHPHITGADPAFGGCATS